MTTVGQVNPGPDVRLVASCASAGTVPLRIAGAVIWIDGLCPSRVAAVGPHFSPRTNSDSVRGGAPAGEKEPEVDLELRDAIVELYAEGVDDDDRSAAARDRRDLRDLMGGLALAGRADAFTRRGTGSIASVWDGEVLAVAARIAVVASASTDLQVQSVARAALQRFGSEDDDLVPWTPDRLVAAAEHLSTNPLPPPPRPVDRQPRPEDDVELHELIDLDVQGNLRFDPAVQMLGLPGDPGRSRPISLVSGWALRGSDALRRGDGGSAVRWLTQARGGYALISATAGSPGGEALAGYAGSCAASLDRYLLDIDWRRGIDLPGRPAAERRRRWTDEGAGPRFAAEVRAAAAPSPPFRGVSGIVSAGTELFVLEGSRTVTAWNPDAPWRRPRQVLLSDDVDLLVGGQGCAACLHETSETITIIRPGTPEPAIERVDLGDHRPTTAAPSDRGWYVGTTDGAVLHVGFDGQIDELVASIHAGDPGDAAPDDNAVHTVGPGGSGPPEARSPWFAVTQGGRVADLDPQGRPRLRDLPKPEDVDRLDVCCAAVASDGSIAVGYRADSVHKVAILPADGEGATTYTRPDAPVMVWADGARVLVADAGGGIASITAGAAPRSAGRHTGGEALVVVDAPELGGRIVSFADGEVWFERLGRMEPMAVSLPGALWAGVSHGGRTYAVTELGTLVVLAPDDRTVDELVPVTIGPDPTGGMSVTAGPRGTGGACSWKAAEGIEIVADRAEGRILAIRVDADTGPDALRSVFGPHLTVEELATLSDDDTGSSVGWVAPDHLGDLARVAVLSSSAGDEPASPPEAVAADELERILRTLLTNAAGPNDPMVPRHNTLVNTIVQVVDPPLSAHFRQAHARLLQRIEARDEALGKALHSFQFANLAVLADHPALADHAVLADGLDAAADLLHEIGNLGRAEWDRDTCSAEMAELRLEGDRSAATITVEAEQVDDLTAWPHTTVVFRRGPSVAAVVHLGREGRELFGSADLLWPTPTDVHLEIDGAPAELTIHTDVDLAWANLAVVAEERRLAAATPGAGGADPDAWAAMADAWDRRAQEALRCGAPWSAAPAWHRAHQCLLRWVATTGSRLFTDELDPHDRLRLGQLADSATKAVLLDAHHHHQPVPWLPLRSSFEPTPVPATADQPIDDVEVSWEPADPASGFNSNDPLPGGFRGTVVVRTRTRRCRIHVSFVGVGAARGADGAGTITLRFVAGDEVTVDGRAISTADSFADVALLGSGVPTVGDVLDAVISAVRFGEG